MTGPPGTGSGAVAEAVLDELRVAGHEARLLYPDNGPATPPADPDHRVWWFPIEGGPEGGETAETAETDGVSIVTFPKMIPDPHPEDLEVSATFRDLTDRQLELCLARGREVLAEAVDAYRPDIIDCHHIWTFPYHAAELGLRYVVEAHHSDQMGYRYDPRMRPQADRAAGEAAAIVAQSEFVRDEVIDLYPTVSADKVVMISPGYDAQTFRPFAVDRAAVLADAGIDAPADLPIVTFAGKISHTKGVDVLLRANRRLQERSPALLVVAGTGEIDQVFSAEERADFHLENVVFLDHVGHDILARLHNLAPVSVVPSREEGFCVSALEAMGCATPVVATRSGGLESFAVGALVDPGDPLALADALIQVLSLDPAARRELEQNALEAAQRYSWRRATEERLELFREVIR